MKAAIYSKDAPHGVRLDIVPKPTLKSTFYEPTTTTRIRSWSFKLIHFIFHLLGCVMKVLRLLFPRIPEPYGESPNRQWVLCRVHSGGMNPVDAKFLYGDKLPHFCLPLVKWFVEDRISGIDFSGVVVDAPAGCQFKSGDAVFGTIPPFCGSFAEYVRAPTDFISHKPSNISFSQASTIPLVGLTVLQAFEDNNLLTGQHILILGASGGTGHVAVQIAKIKGARVTAVTSSRNFKFVKDLGADEILVYDSSEDIFERLSAITTQHGSFDMVFDSVSSHDQRDRKFAYESRIRNAQPKLLTGTYILIGGIVHDWILAHLKRFFGLDLFTNGRQLFWVRFPNSSNQLAMLRRFCEMNQLKINVAHQFPFTEEGIQEAFELQMSRRVVGKIVLEISNSTDSDDQ